VHGLTDGLVSSEREGQVGDTTADVYFGHQSLDFGAAVNKLHSVSAVFFNTSCNSQDIRIEDNVAWLKSDFFSQDLVSSVANGHLVVAQNGLTFLIKLNEKSLESHWFKRF